MDPVSLASSAIGLVVLARKSLSIASSKLFYGELGETVLLETQICVQLLEDLGAFSLSSTSEVPPSASLCLSLCHQNLDNLQRLLKKKSVLKESRDISHALKEFRRSVKLFRDIMSEYGLSELLWNRADFLTTRDSSREQSLLKRIEQNNVGSMT